MTRTQRAAWRLTFLLIFIAAWMIPGDMQNALASPAKPASCTDCTGTFYGGSATYVNLAVANTWPQQGGQYCGIESAIALVNYDNENNGQPLKFNSNGDQVTLGNYNQSVGGLHSPPGMSQWGWGWSAVNNPPNKYGGGTNIAPDFGTDPRSIAWMAWSYSLLNKYFHDHIYSWHQDPYGQQTLQQQVGHATTLLARALNNFGDPVIVQINGGAHSVLLTGIWSGNDIYNNYPAAIQGLVYRDPEGDSNTNRQELNYSFWVNGGYQDLGSDYALWSVWYGDKYGPPDYLPPGNGQNTNDPEPTVGPYVPGQRYQTHWYGNFDWIQIDQISGYNPWTNQNDAWNPDYAINAVSGVPV